MSERNLLVIGARPNSIGFHVKETAEAEGWSVTTAGIDKEDIHLDFDRRAQYLRGDVANAISGRPFHAVVCTAGINLEGELPERTQTIERLRWSMDVNVYGPLAVLEHWLSYWATRPDVNGRPLHFAAISSNSAQVPRSTGLPYCASKAALSAAIQCTARHIAHDPRLSVYAYEPGWVDGTPMAQEVEDRLAQIPGGYNRSRTPGDRALEPQELARMIVANLDVRGALNGCRIRIDGGEA